MRSRSASLAACSLALLLAACGGGGGPRLSEAVAQELAAGAERVAVTGCAPGAARALVGAAIAAVNARRVPARLQEELLGRVNELAATCVPSEARALAAWLRAGGGSDA